MNKRIKAKKAASQADAPVPTIVVQNLTVRAPNRKSQDIGSWRNAMRAAEATNPRRTELYDLYEDLLLDAHLRAVSEKRIVSITNADWQFVKDGKVIDQINDMIDTPEFELLLREMMLAEFWGYSMLEFKFNQNYRFGITSVPRKHMRPEKGMIAKEQTGDGTINIREGIYLGTVMEVGDPKSLGLLLPAAQYVIYKRGAFGDWSQFAELFGMPFRKATYDGYDDGQRVKMEEALEKMGSAPYVVLPDGSNIEFIANSTNSDGSLYKELLQACNSELSKLFLGQTMTTENGSSKSQGEVHKEVEEAINKADRRRIRRILNTRFLKIMEANGIPVNGGYFVIKGEDEEKISKKDKLEMDIKLVKDLGLPFDPEYFYEEYGMPKPDNYEEQLRKKEENKPEPPADPGADPDKPDKGGKDDPKEVKKKVELMLDRFINIKLSNFLSFFGQAPAHKTGASKMNCCGSHLTLSLSSRLNDDQLIKRIWEAEGNASFDNDLFFFTSEILLKGVKGGFVGEELIKLTNLGFQYGIDDPALLTSFEMNLFRFSAAKTLAQVQELNKLFRKAKDFESFYKAAKKVTEIFNRAWLETEYNTAYLTGESSATYNRLLAQTTLFPYWEYKTVGDNKVRAEHRALDGLILPANDPRWQKLFPPNGWNCRCYVVPRMKSEVADLDLDAERAKADLYFESAEFKNAEAQGWGVNRAETGEVFNQNQFYIKKFPGKAKKLLDNLGHADYKLPSYSQAKKVAASDLPRFSDRANQFLESQEKVNGVPVIRDYHNRPASLTDRNFKAHTTGKKEVRTEYLEAMKETLKNPDEVWINSYDGENYDNFISIKYYLDETMIVVSRIAKGKIYEVSTWFPLREKKDVINSYRRGLLIFNK